MCGGLHELDAAAARDVEIIPVYPCTAFSTFLELLRVAATVDL